MVRCSGVGSVAGDAHATMHVGRGRVVVGIEDGPFVKGFRKQVHNGAYGGIKALKGVHDLGLGARRRQLVFMRPLGGVADERDDIQEGATGDGKGKGMAVLAKVHVSA